jgi:hypothetical protein
VEAAEIEKFVSDLEIACDRLRSLYEQYFMGIEKIEPMVPRKDVDRRIQVLRKEQIRNTAQRFRFQMLLQRYNTYQTHWQRICREIDNGTYIRHLIKAKRRFGDAVPSATGRGRSSMPPPPSAQVPVSAPGQAPPPQLAAELAELDRDFAPAEEILDGDLELVDEGTPGGAPAATQGTAAGATSAKRAWRKAEPAAPRAASPTAPAVRPVGATAAPTRTTAPAVSPARAPAAAAPVAGPRVAPAPAAPTAPARVAVARPVVAAPAPVPRKEDLPDDRVRQLYAQYVETKRKQNESTAAITYEGIARTLRDSSAKLREKHGKAVDFEVTVKDGKTILKPVLK